MSTTEAENKELVRKLWHEVVVGDNLEVIDELVADDIVAHSNAVPEPVHGSAQYKEFIAKMRSGMSDPEMTVKDVIAEDDTVALRASSTFIHDGGLMGIEPTGTSPWSGCLSVTENQSPTARGS